MTLEAVEIHAEGQAEDAYRCRDWWFAMGDRCEYDETSTSPVAKRFTRR